VDPLLVYQRVCTSSTDHDTAIFFFQVACDGRLKQVFSQRNDTAVAVTDYLNLAGLVSRVSNPMTLVVMILSDQSVICSVSASHLLSVRHAWNFNRGVTI